LKIQAEIVFFSWQLPSCPRVGFELIERGN